MGCYLALRYIVPFRIAHRNYVDFTSLTCRLFLTGVRCRSHPGVRGESGALGLPLFLLKEFLISIPLSIRYFSVAGNIAFKQLVI